MKFSNNTNWETPKYLFNYLSRQFGGFTYDLAASDDNALCETYFTEEHDSLSRAWGRLPGTKWLNPPYGRGIEEWVQKATLSRTPIVALLPANTSTGWFHRYVLEDAELTWITPRVEFTIDGKKGKSVNTGGNVIAVYGRVSPLEKSLDLRNIR